MEPVLEEGEDENECLLYDSDEVNVRTSDEFSTASATPLAERHLQNSKASEYRMSASFPSLTKASRGESGDSSSSSKDASTAHEQSKDPSTSIHAHNLKRINNLRKKLEEAQKRAAEAEQRAKAATAQCKCCETTTVDDLLKRLVAATPMGQQQSQDPFITSSVLLGVPSGLRGLTLAQASRLEPSQQSFTPSSSSSPTGYRSLPAAGVSEREEEACTLGCVMM